METLTMTTFISVIVPLFGGFVIAAYILFNRITALTKTNAEIIEREKIALSTVKDLQNSLDRIEINYDQLERQRHIDLLDFTKILAGINTTLAKVEVTLNHFDGAIREVKSIIEEMRKG